jgi:hypothetical protein
LAKIDCGLENLTLNAEGKLDAIFGGQHVIWVPPSVSLSEDSTPQPYIVYRVPEHWELRGTESGIHALVQMGWQRKADTANLLKDFLGLVREEDITREFWREDIPGELQIRVKTFAQQWGPLWVCREPSHDKSLFGKCYWSPLAYENCIYDTSCTWEPCEDIVEFIEQVQYAKAVLRAASLIQQNASIPEKLWDILKPKYFRVRHFTGTRKILARLSEFIALPENTYIPCRKLYLSLIVNEHLADLRAPRLLLLWAGDAKLSLGSGLGFLRAVWVEIAQILGNVKSFYYCAGCGGFYLSKRKRKYCEVCIGGKNEDDEPRNLRAKQESARRRRALARQAQQLYKEGVTLEDIVQQLKPGAGRIKVDLETVQKWVLREGSSRGHRKSTGTHFHAQFMRD